MSDSSLREWRLYVDDMIGFARRVLAYTRDVEQDGFGIGVRSSFSLAGRDHRLKSIVSIAVRAI